MENTRSGINEGEFKKIELFWLSKFWLTIILREQ